MSHAEFAHPLGCSNFLSRRRWCIRAAHLADYDYALPEAPPPDDPPLDEPSLTGACTSKPATRHPSSSLVRSVRVSVCMCGSLRRRRTRKSGVFAYFSYVRP